MGRSAAVGRYLAEVGNGVTAAGGRLRPGALCGAVLGEGSGGARGRSLGFGIAGASRVPGRGAALCGATQHGLRARAGSRWG